MRYPNDMDPLCEPLCDAINEIPGLKTTESCCGHGKNVFIVFIKARTVRSLYVLARCLSRNYGMAHAWGWRCTLSCTDMEEEPVTFCIESTARGLKAYNQSYKIAENIRRTLANPAVRKLFKIG